MSPIDLTSFLVFLYTSQVAVRKDCDGFKLVEVQQWLIMRWRFEAWDRIANSRVEISGSNKVFVIKEHWMRCRRKTMLKTIQA